MEFGTKVVRITRRGGFCNPSGYYVKYKTHVLVFLSLLLECLSV